MSADRDKKLAIKVGTKARTIHVDYLARVEGEGSLHIHMKGEKVESARLHIFEPPRFFEAMLKHRPLEDAPDITARICGICPVAYQMSAVYAMEDALGLCLPESIHQLRRLMYCGEWIQSHALHVYMLHAPDFLKESDAIAIAKKDPSHIKRALRIKSAGNQIIKILGGREIHPINVRVGGFFKLPTQQELFSLKTMLQEALSDALEGLHWVSSFPFPQKEEKYELLSLCHPSEYPMARGSILTSSGLSFDAKQMLTHIQEEHREGSTALFASLGGKSYLVGPMARLNLNYQKLPSKVHAALQEAGLELPCYNPYKSIIIRCAEIVYSFLEALRIIEEYDDKQNIHCVPYTGKQSMGFAATEAPRGLLYHHYHLNDQGVIQEARIIPPTSQNQRAIEEDIFFVAQKYASQSDDELRYQCEMSIRNFDPCISCATHFLSLQRSYE